MTYFEGDNIGSILQLEYCLHTGFSSFNPAILAPGHAWEIIPIKDESSELFLKLIDTPHGPTYTYSGPFKLHRQRDEVESTLFKFIGKSLILRLTDMNGRVYIIGMPGQPVSFTLDAKTGQRYTDENGYAFQFEITQTVKAFAL